LKNNQVEATHGVTAKRRGRRINASRMLADANNGPPRVALIESLDNDCSPLGILWANGVISELQRRAGRRYAWLQAVVAGKASVAAEHYRGPERGTMALLGPAWHKAREEDLSEAVAALTRLGARHKYIIDRICLYDHVPRFMTPVIPTHADIEEGKAMFEALKALDDLAKGAGFRDQYARPREGATG
jgi:hypothetical protein